MSTPNPPESARAEAIRRLSLAELQALGDGAVRRLLAEFRDLIGAHEVAIWARDPEAPRLVPILDTAGPGGGFEMQVGQELNSGIVSQVFREQKSFREKGLWRSRLRSPNVDLAMNQITQNEMCVPFHLGGFPLGVMSAVQVTDNRHAEPKRWGFDDHGLKVLELAAQSLAQAMERAFLERSASGSPG